MRSDTDLLPIEGAANSWHTDVSFIDRVPKASVLRAVTLPAYGGATQWASATAAYDLLPEPLRLLADNLRAVHSNDYDYVTSVRNRSAEDDERYHAEFVRLLFETEHPSCGCTPRPVTGAAAQRFREEIRRSAQQRFVGALRRPAAACGEPGPHGPLVLGDR
ncbi:TauD/TfdA dioxygenase family protein [Mycolicibacterium sp.]|uniref:TauD/TfdA dioxygenase family protein n=1 Tax=Mycolicibacterium sp. TaxID=2320850 RepID=UPI003D0A7148